MRQSPEKNTRQVKRHENKEGQGAQGPDQRPGTQASKQPRRAETEDSTRTEATFYLLLLCQKNPKLFFYESFNGPTRWRVPERRATAGP